MRQCSYKKNKHQARVARLARLAITLICNTTTESNQLHSLHRSYIHSLKHCSDALSQRDHPLGYGSVFRGSVSACPRQCRASPKSFKPSPDIESCTNVVGSLGDDIGNADGGLRLCLEGGLHAYSMVLAVSGTLTQQRRSQPPETHDLSINGTWPISSGKATLSIILWRVGNARIG